MVHFVTISMNRIKQTESGQLQIIELNIKTFFSVKWAKMYSNELEMV